MWFKRMPLEEWFDKYQYDASLSSVYEIQACPS